MLMLHEHLLCSLIYATNTQYTHNIHQRHSGESKHCSTVQFNLYVCMYVCVFSLFFICNSPQQLTSRPKCNNATKTRLRINSCTRTLMSFVCLHGLCCSICHRNAAVWLYLLPFLQSNALNETKVSNAVQNHTSYLCGIATDIEIQQ